MTIAAAGADADAARGFLTLAFLFVAGYFVLSFFFRRVGGKGGGAEKASVGAWFLLAAIVIGIMVATKR